MNQDLNVTLGLDDQAFVKSLDKSGSYGKRKAWQIAKDFDRAERAKTRSAQQHSAKIARSYQKLERVNQVASVAMAAGVGLVSLAMSKAAVNNADLRHEIELTKKSSDRFLADIGNDLQPLIGGLDDIIDRAGKARGSMVDFFAIFGSNQTDVKNKNKVIEGMRQGDQRFANEKRAQEIRTQISGNSGDPDEGFRRSMQEKINGVDDRSIKMALREALAVELEKRKRKREQEQSSKQNSSNQRFHQSRFDDEAAAAEARSARNPGDLQARKDAILARAKAKRNRATNTIDNDDSLSREEKTEAVNRQLQIINQQTAKQLEDARQAAEMEERRIKGLEREAKIMAEQYKIDQLRAEGRDKEADAMALKLASEERLQRIREQEGLSDEQRASLIAAEEMLLKTKEAKAGAGSGTETIGTLGPGFAGDAATAAQALGVRSEGQELITIGQTQTNLLTSIEQNTKDGTARVG